MKGKTHFLFQSSLFVFRINISIIICLICLFRLVNLNTTDYLWYLSSFSWLALLFSSLLLLTSSCGCLSFGLIFLLFYTSYQLLPFLFYFFEGNRSFNFIRSFEIISVVPAWEMVIIFLCLFSLVASFQPLEVYSRINNQADYSSPKNISSSKKIFTGFALFLVFLTILPYLHLNLSHAYFSIQHGYSELISLLHLERLYERSILTKIISKLASLHMPAVLIFYYTSLSFRQKRLARVAIFLLIINFLIMMTIGYRARASLPLFSGLVIYQVKVRPLPLKKWFLIGVFLLLLSNFVQDLRNLPGTWTSRIENFSFLQMKEDPLKSLSAEGTTRALFTTVLNVPKQQSHWGGGQFLFDSLTGIPIIGQHLKVGVLPSEWYNKLVFPVGFEKGFGIGYSLVAESFAYFGNFYVLFPILLGLIIGSGEKILSNSKPLAVIAYIPLMNYLLFSPRDTLYNVFASFFSISLPIGLLFIVMSFAIKTSSSFKLSKSKEGDYSTSGTKS